MRMLFTCLLAALALVHVPVPISGTDLRVFNPRLKNPYGGKKQLTLLDMDMKLGTICADNVQVQINIPLTSDPALGNAHFSGAPFSDVPVTGTSSWSRPAPSTVSLSWDGTSILTISNIQSASGPGANDHPGDQWINLNLDIPIPLSLVLNDDAIQADATQTPYINFNIPDLFTATAQPCDDTPISEQPKNVPQKPRKIIHTLSTITNKHQTRNVA